MDTIDVQSVFSKVIDANLYQGYLMCCVLTNAERKSLITQREYTAAKLAIDDYLDGCVTLGVALARRKLPCDISARIAVYKDWDNRPKFNP